MKIKRLVGGNLESNGYFVYDCEGGYGYVIDPGYKGEAYLALRRELDIEIMGILLTHYHYDHVGAVEKLRSEWNCPVYLHRDDCDLYQKPVDQMLFGGERFTLSGETLLVVSTPGHTAGSVCFQSESTKSRIAFTGDTVFNVDLGRTDLESGSEEEMIRSVCMLDRMWDNDITIYPGHGDPASMKFVRQYNREFADCLAAGKLRGMG